MRRRSTCRRNLHRLTPENTYVDPKGKRRCKACRATKRRRHYRAHREEALAYQREHHRRTYVPKELDRELQREILAKGRATQTELLIEGRRIQPMAKWMVDRWGVTTTAKVLGVHRETVYNMLRGNPIRPRTARKLVDVMNYQAGQAEIHAGRVAA